MEGPTLAQHMAVKQQQQLTQKKLWQEVKDLLRGVLEVSHHTRHINACV